jgi:protein-L-isoaspartate(D-aspartate) O-methyltransferase
MMTDYAAARLRMVESQIRPNKVTDFAILEAFLDVARERFAPEGRRGVAYVDEDLPLGNGRCLMEPMVLGRFLQQGGLVPEDRVLVVGAGTGYDAAVVSRVAKRVVALESDKELAMRARSALASVGATSVAVREGPLEAGWPDQAPYDLILVGGAVGLVPDALAAQLAEGGRLVAVVKDAPGLGKATLFMKARGAVSKRVLFDAGTMPLPGFVAEPGFVF